ncbi:FtsW/RodA/SpoVE family cell cycle protein [Pectinatus cerevisiiphilus]|uniref:Cell division protein FtsW (Lipid II flippase) n=1 Tax=Pectinatus cerevisiiphilus TaxID=86956 RepID=A0A4V2UR93_9FIRM|nr:FtsW/RodA/SpoVE family cell cycle protein [Pectinatus cerevisiiphilus]TCS76452.1 cell division protein FtsW (lipid II flippase) [Pectinatus cerevisiiphilus]
MYYFKKKVLFLQAMLPALAMLLFYVKDGFVVKQENVIITAGACLILVIVPLIAQKVLKNIDVYILSLVCFLCSISLIMMLRLRISLYHTQFQWIVVGMILMFCTIVFSEKILRFLDYPYILGVLSILIIGSVLLFGTEIGGNRNWIIMGPVQVQPSEFAKLLILGFLAAYLQENKNMLNLPNRHWGFLYLPPLRFLAPLVTIWSMALLMFVYQRDLGSALLFFGMAVMMTYAATSNKSYVFLAVVFFIISAFISYLAFGHVRVRVAIWLNPWADPMGQSYQIVQSLFALGYGGFFGTGFWQGSPDIIPAVYTDFIFSAIGEEFGFIGVFSVIMAYLLIFFRSVKIALLCQNEKYKLLSFGLAGTMLLQSFIILAGVTKLLPLTGITLPFISYGGSSMVASFIGIGLLLAISTKEKDRAC